MINKLFIYGTLQKGMSNQSFLPDEAIVNRQKATIKGELYWVERGCYPALLLEGHDTIYGELVEIKSEYFASVLKNCDRLEGHPSFYKREQVNVNLSNGETVECYSYIFKQFPLLGSRIYSGNFIQEYNILYGK